MNNATHLLISSIYEKIWELSPNYKLPDSYSNLQELTKQLIDLYNLEGRLDENPFSSTEQRVLSLPVSSLNELIKSSTILVTGGLGCVGSSLVKQLLNFDVDKIIIVDKQSSNDKIINNNNRLVNIKADICEVDILNTIFETYQPDFVFHTAAQRDPGYAEHHIAETVQVNITGTLNVLNACEKSNSVKQCVFSSTGKASRYFTNEVYAATKKICEHLFDTYARQSDILYSMVRFTHILDNSLMNNELQKTKDKDHLAIHSPGKYVTAQNALEAANLLLNALLSAEKKQSNFLIVRHLEWPVESLEVALYYIKIAERPIPVIFKGNPMGYCEKFFRGQMDWSNPQELNLLINVYEQKNRTYNKDGDIIISSILPVEKCVLQNALLKIQNATGEAEIKDVLMAELKNIVRSSFANANRQDTLNILEWGLEPKHMITEGTTIADYGPTISLLIESLDGNYATENSANLSPV